MTYLIVDDEPPARKLLQTYMQAVEQCQLVKLCDNALDAYEALQLQRVDLMFLDIKMPLVSGTDFLRSLKNPPMVILTTAYPKYALEGFELNVIDYLLKPIAFSRLLQAVDKARNRQTQPALPHPPGPALAHLFVKADQKLVKVDLADIQLIEGMQNYVKLHLTTRVLIASYTMKALEELLPAYQFLRVHRSFIVPIAAIVAINGNVIETGSQSIPIGVSYRDAIHKLTGQ